MLGKCYIYYSYLQLYGRNENNERVTIIVSIFMYDDDYNWGGCPRGVMVKAMNCRIVVSEFVLQSRYYVHFRTNTLGKGMNPLILPAMG